jgi:hypothetical protein
VKLSFPAIKALQSRFKAGSFCVAADRGMISDWSFEQGDLCLYQLQLLQQSFD